MVILVILYGDMLRLPHFQTFKQFIQRGLIFVIVLMHFPRPQKFHYHREVLLFFRCLVFQIKDQRQKKHGRRRIPERIVALAPFRRGGFKQVGHKPLHIIVILQIDKGIVTIAFLHVDQIQHPDVIAFRF